jgi:hypothetical protein
MKKCITIGGMIGAIFGAEESDGHNQSEYKVSDKSKSGKMEKDSCNRMESESV